VSFDSEVRSGRAARLGELRNRDTSALGAISIEVELARDAASDAVAFQAI
jgi:hypothetical protein